MPHHAFHSARSHVARYYAETHSDDDMEHDVVEERLKSHALAEPSSASAAASGSQKGKKRDKASIAFQDALSLLPANLDEQLLCRTLQQLPARHRMQKNALLQGYKQHFDHWRFLLRCANTCIQQVIT